MEAKVFIAVPTKAYIHCRTVVSIDAIRKVLTKNNIETELVFAEGTIVPAVRTVLVKEFLKRPEFTHLLFVDSDQTFKGNAVADLLKHDKDVIVGISKVRSNEGYNIYNFDETTSKYIMVPVDEGMGLVNIDGAGMGLMLIKRKVLECVGVIETCGDISEDLNFCKKVKELNFEVFADCKNRIGHLVEIELN